MKPLLVLLTIFSVSLLLLYILTGQREWSFAGRIGMSAMLVFTAIGHFVFTRGMAMMLPSRMPAKKTIVYVTGAIEIAAAIGLLIPNLQTTTGWWLILFFIVILPANISAAFRQVDYQKATTNGSGPAYLWFQIPLQLFFIARVYWFAIKAAA